MSSRANNISIKSLHRHLQALRTSVSQEAHGTMHFQASRLVHGAHNSTDTSSKVVGIFLLPCIASPNHRHSHIHRNRFDLFCTVCGPERDRKIYCL